MSNRMFQSVIHQMRDAIDRTVGVMDETFTVISCSNLGRIGEVHTLPPITSSDSFVKGSYTYKPFGTAKSNDYILFVEGVDPQAEKYVALLSVALTNLKQFYDERYDRANFIKNVILENILSGDVYLKARELHFNNTTTRAVLLLRVTSSNDVSVYDILQNIFPDKNKDFVISINETDIAVVKEVSSSAETADLEKMANSISDTLSGEFFTHVLIGIGTVVEGVKDLSRSFKEAQMALEVGKVFDTEKTIVCYDNLGIARLIYQLPVTLCETFLREVFNHGSIESLDYETLFTIQKFFENNLNVSETSRRLFVHRNTLVYRLDKIKKLTGLDLRKFDHAIIFKIALMVKKYLSASPTKY